MVESEGAQRVASSGEGRGGEEEEGNGEGGKESSIESNKRGEGPPRHGATTDASLPLVLALVVSRTHTRSPPLPRDTPTVNNANANTPITANTITTNTNAFSPTAAPRHQKSSYQ
ncbi:hypothetical protein E2C01_030106 [Portunus trituberculatus]|uniref:Uncharacterized protein n=1 Tax=Portunus trituberculatus TaxID=210409 RepID=A0A5B7EPM0_PORTR|nr:hypothetical protein [Portunus trituberculatus]